jgi:hypothetical protein
VQAITSIQSWHCALTVRLRSITEQPFKIPCVAALFSLIAQRPDSSDDALETAAPSPAQPLFQELCKGFQTSLDRLSWRDLRLTVRFLLLLAYISRSIYRYNVDAILRISRTYEDCFCGLIP